MRSLGEYARNDGEGRRSRRRERRRAYGYEGAEVVGDDADGEEDAVLRHHGRALGGGEGCAGVLAFWVRDAVAGGGLAGSPRLNPSSRGRGCDGEFM